MSVEPIILAHEPPFELGPVHVRPELREMECAGRIAILEPRVMQVLIALYRAGGHVVSKDDLVLACWEGRVVGDDAINRVISRLRRNAQDDAGGAFKVETVTKVGYRMAMSSGQALPSATPVSRRAALVTGAGLAAASLIGGGGYWLLQAPEREQRAELGAIRRTLLMGTPDQSDNAATQARHFVERHPGSSDGWALYAVATYFRTGLPSTKAALRKRAEIYARRALRLDPQQSDARTVLASLRGFSGRWIQAYRDIQPVYRDSPDGFFVNNFLTNLFSSTGNSALSQQHAERSLTIEDEAPPLWMQKALALDNLGRLSEAQNVIEEAYARWPKQYAIWFTRLYLLGYYGRTAEALAMMRSSADWPVGIPPDNQALTRSQVIALGDRRPSLVDEAVRRSLDMASRGTGFAENAMQFTAALDMPDLFFSLAERYFFDVGFIRGPARFSEEQRVYSRSRNTWFLFRRPVLGMWRDPRFDALLSRIGLDAFWRDTGFAPEYRQMRQD